MEPLGKAAGCSSSESTVMLLECLVCRLACAYTSKSTPPSIGDCGTKNGVCLKVEIAGRVGYVQCACLLDNVLKSRSIFTTRDKKDKE